jgi:hypothetical protein
MEYLARAHDPEKREPVSGLDRAQLAIQYSVARALKNG